MTENKIKTETNPQSINPRVVMVAIVPIKWQSDELNAEVKKIKDQLIHVRQIASDIEIKDFLDLASKISNYSIDSGAIREPTVRNLLKLHAKLRNCCAVLLAKYAFDIKTINGSNCGKVIEANIAKCDKPIQECLSNLCKVTSQIAFLATSMQISEAENDIE
jgi:hypothetical protein